MNIDKSIEPKVDGRKQRSERSREAILDATMELINEGNLMPTAQEVSIRADVGIRSVFRHFADMDSLYASMNIVATDIFNEIYGEALPSGTLNDRIQHAVTLYHKGFEANKNMLLTTMLRRAESDLLIKQYRQGMLGIEKDFERRVPELVGMPEVVRHAVAAARSFATYDRLRIIQGLSQKKSTAAVIEIITAVMNKNQP